MADNDFYKIDRLLPYRTKAQGRTHIKDGDLQIQMPNVKETVHLDSTVNFKNILSQYLGELGNTAHTENVASLKEHEDIQKAMDEAASSFQSMMQIRKELEDAYKEIMQMQG